MKNFYLITLLTLTHILYGQFVTREHPMVIRPYSHKGLIWDLDISPDGSKVITAGQDKTVKVWDLKQGFELRDEFIGHIGPEKYGANYAAELSPDGRYLATAGFYGDPNNRNRITDIRIYDVKTHAITQLLKGHSNVVRDLVWTKDGSHLVSASSDNTIKIWNPRNGDLVRTLSGHGDVIYDIDVFNNKVISASKDNLVMLWDINTGQAIATSYDHFDAVKVVSFSKDGQWLFSGSSDKQINVYNTELLLTNAVSLNDTPSSLSFSQDGKTLVVGMGDGSVILFSVDNSTLVETARYKPHRNGFVANAILTNDGKVISAGGIDSNIAVYELTDGKPRQAINLNHMTQRVWSAGLNKSLLVFSIGDMSTFSGLRNVKFTHGFDMVSRDFDKLDQTGRNIITITSGTGISNLKTKFKGRNVNIKAPVNRLGAIHGVNYKDKIVVTYKPLGDDPSWLEQQGKYTGYQYGEIICQIADGIKKQNFTFLPDSVLVACGTAGYMKAFNLDGQLLSTFIGHEDLVFTVSTSTDVRWLISGSHDNSIRIWDRNEIGAKKIITAAATCYFSTDGEWIVATDENYYMSSKNGGKYIGFHQNNGFSRSAKFYPFENFDLKYNRPDKVLERLELGSEKLRKLLHLAYQKRLIKTGISEEQLSDKLSLPVVRMNTVTQSVNQSEFKLNVVATDAVHDLNRLNVFMDDVPIYGREGIVLQGKGKQFEDELKLRLLPGKNRIQVSVMNSAGVESLKETLIVHYNAPKTKPALHIVTIGVSNYADSEYDLDYAARDAKDVAAFFSSPNDRYSKVHQHHFIDIFAQREQILAVKEQLEKTDINDEVIIFLAGHGLLDEKLNYYFATQDIDFNHPAERGIRYEELESLLNAIPARKKLMLIDACHSGEVDKEEVELVKSELRAKGVNVRGFTKRPQPVGVDNVFELMQELFADLRRGTGATVISSASGMEFALESEQWKNGVFTYAILEGLKNRKCDHNKDGKVQVSELKDYVFDRVTALTYGKQHPTSRRENLTSDFVLW